MSKNQQTYQVVKVIGVISILFGVYSVFTGGSFGDYFYSILIGAILLGSASINGKESEERENG